MMGQFEETDIARKRVATLHLRAITEADHNLGCSGSLAISVAKAVGTGRGPLVYLQRDKGLCSPSLALLRQPVAAQPELECRTG